MVRFIIAGLLFVSLATRAQQPVTFISVDSITYQNYLTGDWNNLLSVGKEAVRQGVDFKRLRQRMGYACFVTGDYFAAQFQYEKALAFDEYDPDTREYLYYCGLNTGNEANARLHASKLPKELQQKLRITGVKPVDAIDLEYNYKANKTLSRSNPTYLRAGITTQLGYRLSLYQSVSTYQQTVDSVLTRQPEYFALLSWSLNSHTSIRAAYHYLNTSLDNTNYPGNLLFAALSTKRNRISFGLNGSILNTNLRRTIQFGLLGGINFPGKSSIYLNSILSGMKETGSTRVIFSQTIGGRLTKKVWAEGNVTLGNLHNYHDHQALYIYNSVDPTIFRTGLTLYWHLSHKFSLFGNSTFEKKQIELNSINYNQQSFSGGLIWKL